MSWDTVKFILSMILSGFFVKEIKAWLWKKFVDSKQDRQLDSVIKRYLENQRNIIKFENQEIDYHTIATKAVQHGDNRKSPQVGPKNQGIIAIKNKFRLILSRKEGGNGLPPQLVHLDRKYLSIGNIVQYIWKYKDPIVLLGDPGAGKSVTLRQAYLELTEKQLETNRSLLVLFFRLGGVDFSMLRGVNGVREYIKNSLPDDLQVHFDELVDKRRVIVFFDGIDEMDRCHYHESVKALSNYAEAYQKKVKTIFSCRLNDFSKEFKHRQIVLLPFDSKQIKDYFEKNLHEEFFIDGKIYRPDTLLERLKKSQYREFASNPSFLKIFSIYIYTQEKWPTSLSDIFYEFFKTYYRKHKVKEYDVRAYGLYDTALTGWSRIAYCISTETTNGTITREKLASSFTLKGISKELLKQLLAEGVRCRILSIEDTGNDATIRFQHNRYLEYFTAFYLEENDIEIEWGEKLNDPGWQEIFLILACLNSQFSGIEFLEKSLEEAVNDLAVLEIDMIEEEEPEDQSEIERQWSEYVLLGARVVSRIAKKPEKMGKYFWSRLLEAIKLIASVGHPLSQRTVVWACSYLVDINIYDLLERPFVSKYSFVRSTSLYLVNEAFRYNKNIGASYPFEICRGVATEQLLRFVLYYLKALLDRFSVRNLWSTIAGIVISLMFPLILFLGGVEYLISFLSITKSASLPIMNISVYVIMTVLPLYMFQYRNLSLNQSILLTVIGISLCYFFYLAIVNFYEFTVFGYLVMIVITVFLYRTFSIILFVMQYITTTISILVVWPMVGIKAPLRVLYSSALVYSQIGRFTKKYVRRYFKQISIIATLLLLIFFDETTYVITTCWAVVMVVFLNFARLVPLPLNIFFRATIGFTGFAYLFWMLFRFAKYTMRFMRNNEASVLRKKYKRFSEDLKSHKIAWITLITKIVGGITFFSVLLLFVLWKASVKITIPVLMIVIPGVTVFVSTAVILKISIKKKISKNISALISFWRDIFSLSTLKSLIIYTFNTIGVIFLVLLIFRHWLISRSGIYGIPLSTMIVILIIMAYVFYFIYRFLLHLNAMIRKIRLPDNVEDWASAFKEAKNSIEAMKLLEHLLSQKKRMFPTSEFLQILLKINQYVIQYDAVYDRYLEMREDVQAEVRFQSSIHD